MTTQQIVTCADCRTVGPYLGWFDVLLTDPPYRGHVHSSAVSQSKGRGVRKREFGFDSLTPELREFTAAAAGAVKRWGIIYSDVESVAAMKEAVENAGGHYIRTIPWVRWSMPQLSGDRPTTGWEAMLLTLGAECETVIASWGTEGGKKWWNGPGNLTHLDHKCLRGEDKHRAEKPLDQALDLVQWFTDPGDKVLDLYAGAGTIGLACKLLGRNYQGFEIDPHWAGFATDRIYRGLEAMSKRDVERYTRWYERQEAVSG